MTIIMYHYVRPLERSRYPALNGLPVAAFRRQIEYVQERYTVISGPRLLAAVTDGAPLPPDPAVLTFDDGYRDHFTSVFPILDAAGLPACFFPPARCVRDRTVLDVNKIHHILAGTDAATVERRLFRLLEAWGDEETLRSRAAYREAVAGEHRFDDPTVVLVKRLLQRELPDPLRRCVLDRLFDTFVDVSEAVLAEELYMTPAQVRCLQRHGMYVGGHGDRHAWMDRLDPAGQRTAVQQTRAFLEEMGAPVDPWIMCYPYGAHDAPLRDRLRRAGAAVGLATGAARADLDRDDAMVLPRLDTNDLPHATASAPAADSAS